MIDNSLVGNAFLPTRNKSVMQKVGKKPAHPTKAIKRMNAERIGVIVAEQVAEQTAN